MPHKRGSAPLLPASNCPVEVCPVDPDATKSRWANSRKVAGGNQIPQCPGADPAVLLCRLEIEKTCGRMASRRVPRRWWLRRV